MKNDYLFIPDKVKAGFKSYKNDFPDKDFGYFIYWDEKGVLRKEVSWNSWRDKEIPEKDIDNVPLEGYRVHKVRNGYRYSLWEQRDAKVVVEHPTLGCLFEITPANLLELIMANGIDNNGIILSPCIMCWDNTALVLMSTLSSEYESCVSHSKEIKQNKKIKPVIGHTYRDRDGFTHTFLGKSIIYETNEYNDAHTAKAKNVTDNLVTYITSRSLYGSTEKWYEIKKHNVFFFGTSYVGYRKTCPNFVSEVEDAHILSEEECKKIIEKWGKERDWNSNKVEPYMPWKFDYVPISVDVVDAIINKKVESFRHWSRNPYEHYDEVGLIVDKSKDFHKCNPNFRLCVEPIRVYDDGRISIFQDTKMLLGGTRKQEVFVDSLDEAVNIIKPCKIVYYSYLNPEKVIREEY